MRDQTETKLGKAQNGQASGPSKFGKAIAAAQVRHPFTIPRLNLAAEMTLVRHDVRQEIEAAVADRMNELRLEPSTLTEARFEAERATRMMAAVVLEPGTDKPIGTLAEWDALDEEVISDCYRLYLDLRVAYDPIEVGLSRDDEELIFAALKKKDPQLLRLCGTRRLSSFLLSTADRLLASAPPTSTPSESSPGA